MHILSLMLVLAITAGELIKVGGWGRGATLLDIVIILLCLWGLYKVKLKLIKPPFFITGGLLFCFVALLSLILTPLSLSLTSYLFSFLYIFRFFIYILLGWLLVSSALPSLKKDALQVLLLSGVALAILGLLQFIFLPNLIFLTEFGWDPHFFRTASTFLDPNFAGGFFTLTLLALSQYSKKKSFIYSLLVFLALLTTFSRSSYGMFLFSFLSLAFFKRSAKMAFVTILLFVILLLSFQIYITAVNRVTPLDRNQTAGYRFSTWKQGFDIFLKNPLLGVGFNTYNYALKQYNLGDQFFLAGHGSTTNDSSLLYVASTTGVLGFLVYFSFLMSLIKLGLSKNPYLAAALFSLLGHSFFVNSLFYPFILIWIILSASYVYEKSAK